jgi:hypothetical protein
MHIPGIEFSDAMAILIGCQFQLTYRDREDVSFDILPMPVPPVPGVRFARNAASDAFASFSADAISCGIGWPANPSTNPGSGRARK